MTLVRVHRLFCNLHKFAFDQSLISKIKCQNWPFSFIVQKRQIQTGKQDIIDMAPSTIVIRPAKPGDSVEIMRLIIELAEFEKMADQVHIKAETLEKDLFAEKPVCHAFVAEVENSVPSQLTGYTLYYPIYSTWDGISMYLEDLYVTPSLRGTGQGKELWRNVTKVALEWDCARLHLCVLGWNSFAKDLYVRHGFIDLTEKEDWHLMRMPRKAMEVFVKGSKDLKD